MPRAPQLPSSMDDVIAVSDPAALADSLVPPPAQDDSTAPLGKFSTLKLAAICVGVAPLYHRPCMCTLLRHSWLQQAGQFAVAATAESTGITRHASISSICGSLLAYFQPLANL